VPSPLTSGEVPNARFLIETPVEMVPSGQVQVSAGVWSGPVTVREPATDMFLRASDTAGRIANGNLFTVEPSDDSDADGLPDAWETRYFGTIAALPDADPDSDGLNNLEEFRAGTNPVEPASVLSIRAVQIRGSDVVIRFESVGGKLYRLEGARGLTGLEWSVLIGRIPGAGGTVEVVVPGAAGTESFYRLKVVP
jgi:hypothetical protein